MKKKHIAQLVSSIIVGLSTFIIAIITVVSICGNKGIDKKTKNKNVKKVFIAIASAILGIVLINGVLMTGERLYLNYIATAAFLFGVNYYLVELQIKKTNDSSDDSVPPPKEKPSKKKIFIILGISFVALWILFFAGFSAYRIIKIIKLKDDELPDLNGPEDYSLYLLSEEEVVKTYDYVAFLTSEGQYGESTNVDKDHKYYDYDKVNFQAKHFSGVKVLQATNISDDYCTFKINSEVNSGNFDIVIIVDGELHSKVDINQETIISLEGIKDKTVLVKIAGESAECRIEVERNIGDGSSS